MLGDISPWVSCVSAHLAKPLLFQNLFKGVCRVNSFGDNISLHRKGQTCSQRWKRELECPSSTMDRHAYCPFKKTCNPSAQGSSPAMKPTEQVLLKWFPRPLYFMLNANIWIYMRWKGEGCDFIIDFINRTNFSLPGFKFKLLLFLAVCPQASYLTCPHCCFLICKRR